MDACLLTVWKTNGIESQQQQNYRIYLVYSLYLWKNMFTLFKQSFDLFKIYEKNIFT